MIQDPADSKANASVSKSRHEVGADWRTRKEPIAIIGIGCRFPGARGPEAFWRLLRDGVDAITEVPPDRFDIDAVYDPTSTRPGTLCTRSGGFLDQVDQFDPYFFGISPREAARMDPQQRLLLEVSWEALEDAGQVPDKLAGSQTGVFVGTCNSDYGNLVSDPADIDIYVSAGVALSVLSGRLSYVLGLQGPSLTLDTACSTSLVAVHLACQSLWSGECTLALAGGVNAILLPQPGMGFSQAKALAPDGRCKFGDARADGFVRSEGFGVVVLKPLFMALADADPIYAVIRGSAVNNDGRSGGLLMAPSRLGQEAVLREAYRNAGISPSQVQYVEAHGTGTSVGDPIELEALGAVLGMDRPKGRPCLIGSAKTNIGHTEGAAGVTGLIKVALSLRHRAIPPSLHFHEPNPNISWEDLPLVVPRELTSWPVDSGPALAGVSSFGISGTNAHVVLEEAPWTSTPAEETRASTSKPHLLALSAHSSEALEAMARAYQALGAADEDPPDLRDLCYTACVRRSHHDHRLALVVHSREELSEHLEAFLQGELRVGMSSGRKIPDRRRKLVFVFPGQGSQWIGMARELLEQEPVFREAIERCDEAMRADVDWSLLKELTADESHSRFDELDVIQPALFAIQVALATLWRSWGIEPDAVVGHSMGEVAAAHVAGILGLDAAVRIVCRRSQVVRRRASGKGGMAVVELPVEGVKGLLSGYADRLAVAACNSPTTTVVSGDPSALQDLRDTVERQGAFFQMVKVDYASHSPQMELLRDDLLEALGEIHPRRAELPMISTITASLFDELHCDTSYWVRNLREPVLFSQAIDRLAQEGHDIFLEISPHPILSVAIAQCLRCRGQDSTVLPSLRRGEDGRAVMLGSLGALYTLGHPVDWSRLYPQGGRVVRLPFYPWQRERFWLEHHAMDDGGIRKRVGQPNGKRHRLLGQRFQSAVQPGTHVWEMDLGTQLFPYLSDHRVQGLIVLPAAAYVEMALAAAVEAFGPGPHALEKVAFRKALFLPEDGVQTIQLVVSRQLVREASFQFFSREAGVGQQEASWTLHATGTIRLGQPDLTPSVREHESPEKIRARCLEVISGGDFYEATRQQGAQYGSSFQGVEQLWRRDGEAIGRLRLSDTAASESGAYQIHPALLDACFQVLSGALPREDGRVADGGMYLPVGLGSLRVYDRPGTGPWSHALLRSGGQANSDTLEGDVFLLSEGGQVAVEALGFRLQRLERDTQRTIRQNLNDLLFEVQWQPKARLERSQDLDPLPPDQRGSWFIFTDSSGVGQALRGLLEARGERCVMVSPGETYSISGPEQYHLNPARPGDFRQLLSDALAGDGPPCRGVVHLWSLETSPPEETTLDSLEAAQVLGCISVLHLVQALAEVRGIKSPRLWLVTRGAQAVGEEIKSISIAQSPLWGLGRVISVEHPELHCTKVDLSSPGAPEEVQSLFQELWSGDPEDQIALRGDARCVARLVRCSPTAREEKRRPASPDESFRLEISTPGILENFVLRATARRKPGPGEVEIQVSATGLNFREVLMAMGLLPHPFEALDFGFECAGRIAALGEGVEGFQQGDEVIALARACFGPFVTTAASLVVPKPAHLSFEEAATIPVVFLTAYYALHHLARLKRGERVLIHAAAGGIGQAAVQLAQRAGAEIFATAGSPEKREFLKSQGVEHVMDSRSLDFADEVMRLTDGKGVDVVLNSLAGEFIPKSLATLGPGGRFLEIGKVDIIQNSQLGLRQLENNIAFFVIDLGHVLLGRSEEQRSFCRSLLREIMRSFEDGTLRPLPLRVFPISEVASAFRYMAQAKHIGKVVVSLQEEGVLVAPACEQPVTFRPDGTYLITGGLGGLGLVVAQWMVERGARHLVLMGRSGASSPAASEAVDAMRKAGAQVVVAQADVVQEAQLAGVLGDIRQSMPPLRGIIHAAVVLDDGILLQLNRERFRTVMAPKMNGAWNLHALTLNTPLDFFILFSSGASVLGPPGQGNYAPGNAFLDALAHHRRALGLPALAINWGMWGGVGVAARPVVINHLTHQGVVPFTPKQGVELLERILQQGPVQVMALSMDWATLLSSYSPPLLSELAEEVAKRSGPAKSKRTKGGLAREKLLAAEPGERPALMEAFLREQIARVLKCSASKLDPHQPLNKLGIDSLMAVELKNRVEADLETAIPVTALLQGPSLAQLSTLLLNQLPTPASTPPPPPLTRQETAEQLLARVDQLSDTEVESLLRGMVEGEGSDTSQEAQEQERLGA